MKKIVITGSEGLIGWHFQCRLLVEQGIEAIPVGRKAFANDAVLVELLSNCDGIIHLAGMNRGEDAEIEHTNPALAQRLVDTLDHAGLRPHVVFSSSTHIDRETPYGRSKKSASKVLRSWAERSGASYTSLVLPHVFGEHGRPFYNSVVSTFCHQLALGQAPSIEHDGELELLHAQDVVKIALDALTRKGIDEVRPSGRKMRVSELLFKLQSFANSYLNGVIPDLSDRFDLCLFNTFRSYLFPAHYPVLLELHADERGSLFEAVKTEHGGQAFVSTTRPGVSRGNHFHFAKVERFLVVQGEAEIKLRRLFDREVTNFRVTGREPVFIDMPTLHTHSITNVGENELITLFWSHEFFDPERPDTYSESVES